MKRERIFKILILILFIFVGIYYSGIINYCWSQYIWLHSKPFKNGKCEYDISFTSIPPRIDIIPILIERLNKLPDNIRPSLVHLSISKNYKRFPNLAFSSEDIYRLKLLNINIIIVEDNGPINKLVGTIHSKMNSVLIIDDERYLIDELFTAACSHSKYTNYLMNQNMTIRNIPILSFSEFMGYIHLSGSYGYLLPNNKVMLNEALNIYKLKNSIFGIFEDDLWISCIASKIFNHTIHRIHFDANSFLISQLTSSRSAGLIEYFGNSEKDQLEWNLRYNAFLNGNCYDSALKNSVR